MAYVMTNQLKINTSKDEYLETLATQQENTGPPTEKWDMNRKFAIGWNQKEIKQTYKEISKIIWNYVNENYPPLFIVSNLEAEGYVS